MPALPRRNCLLAILSISLTLFGMAAMARDLLDLKRADLLARGEYLVLSGGYDIQLPPALDEALRKGITLTFVQVFEFERPRDYWFSEYISVHRRNLRLSYNALLRQYQLQRESGMVTYVGQSEALKALGDFAEWPVIERKQLNKNMVYQARVRLYLDTSQLAKPLQLNAFASSRWDMDSGWREWSYRP